MHANGAAQNRERSVVGRPFEPGNRANPGGRPKGFAAYVREQTDDGRELVDYVLAVLRGPRTSARWRLEAAAWLADRGWGRPTQSHEVTNPEGGSVVFTLQLGEREDERLDDLIGSLN